ncbi:hypothetical protein A1O7_06645 [Cladophialophora yegresii CBS 114405]|uniref:Oxidase ustYa n=1 Tax=Cladophialophora yegresii CBS 114405 TaxID=1182544 RepID=W9VUF7_9EURO|nr:uncharacterized protein A1O7_06645 [Cladophialophora yegresii CBS 114405]EXJ59213.1 hypothetical protein A1O7_06645 [Cladophialophora yegresii CBS 114405]
MPPSPVENHLVTFAKGNEFEHSLPDTEGSAWNRLLPAGNFGFIQVQDPLRFNVTDGLPFDPHEYQMRPAWHFAERAPGNRTEIFVLSMYHQMHCLIMMRKMFMTMSPEGKVVAGMSPAEDISNGHLNHCFDYLRQAILCAGDTALDHYAWDETGPEPVYGVNGWGATHVCRKLDKIEEFVNENGWYRGRVEQSRVSTS